MRPEVGYPLIAAAILATCKPHTDGVTAAVKDLNDALDSVDAQYGLSPLKPPIAGLRPIVVYEPGRLLLTKCWTGDRATFQSLAHLRVGGKDTTTASGGLGLHILSSIGVGISAGSHTIKSVTLDLTGWSVEEADMLYFRWDSKGCFEEIKQRNLPVVQRVLQFGSMVASVETDDGRSFGIDSAHLKVPDVNISLSGNWRMSSHGTLDARGDSLAVGVNTRSFGLATFKCPPNGGFGLRSGQPLRLVDGCSGGPWYRVAATTSGRSVTLSYQEASVPGSVVRTLRGSLGQEMTLGVRPRRLDLVVVDSGPSESLQLRITRLNIVEVKDVGVLDSPLPDSIADAPIHLRPPR